MTDSALTNAHKSTQGFGEQSLVHVAETSSTALAEQAKAAVQARWIMAMQRPRDLMQSRQRLLDDCARPGFAETAIYRKPVGDGVEGPSIRMAEAAARAMGNIYCEVTAIYDDAQKRIVRVSATDLEANLSFPMDVTIAKTIERSKPLPGRKIVGTRKNSKGYDVFIIEATDEEILDKERATASKAMRTCLLRLIPGDILEEAIERCYATRRGEIAKDPTQARKRMVDAFASLGISAAQLAEHLGHPVDATTPDELDRMRSLHAALKDKETTWSEVMDAVKAERNGGASAETEAGKASLGDRLAAKAEAAKAGGANAAPAASTAPMTPAEMDAADAKHDAAAKKKEGK